MQRFLVIAFAVIVAGIAYQEYTGRTLIGSFPGLSGSLGGGGGFAGGYGVATGAATSAGGGMTGLARGVGGAIGR